MIRSSRRAPNQSSTLGSSDPAATTSMAQPSSVAAAPTPTSCVVPTARRKKNALASTISTMPTVKTNSARPRRLRFECRIPAQDTRVSASSTYSSGSSHGSDVPSRAEVASQVLLGRHLRLLARGEERHQASRRR